MDNLFLTNTACVTGECQCNGSTLKLVEKSNPCSIRIKLNEAPCESDREIQKRIHRRIYIPYLHCICSLKFTRHTSKWCYLGSKSYLKVQWQYVLLYYDTCGQRKCYCGNLNKRIFHVAGMPATGEHLKMTDYHYQIRRNGKVDIDLCMCCSPYNRK